MVGKLGTKSTIKRNEQSGELKFLGGRNTRASLDEVDPRECTEGENFQLDHEDSQFRPREPFDLVGTAPNAAEIRGFAGLQTTAGAITFLVQAGDTVYETDFTTWNNVGTVSSAARLRGPRSQTWNLDDLSIITDVAGVEPVLEWNGTTLSTMTHNLVGDFVARYAYVDSERVYYANVESNAVVTPHLLVASERSNHDLLSTTARPSSALAESDPFFLLTPDIKAINGLTGAFGKIVFSSLSGQIWQLTGSTAKDFAVEGLYPGSFADGDEALAYVGNDIVYGRQGRIESLVATEKFGDVEANEISLNITPDIEGLGGWTIAYNSRLQRIYFHPEGQELMHVYHKPVAQTGLSPWTKFTTQQSMSMNPTTMMALLDPTDGLEYTFLGDESGNVYRLEGTGVLGDAGTVSIRTFRRSKLEATPAMSEAFGFEGYVKYIRGEDNDVDLTILFQGEHPNTETVRLSMPVVGDRIHYGGQNYYGGEFYYGSGEAGQLRRERFVIPGQGGEFQIEVEVDGTEPFIIQEVSFNFKAGG